MSPCHNCNKEMDRFPRDFYDHICTACKQVEDRKEQAIQAWFFFGTLAVVCIGFFFGILIGLLKLAALIKYLSN